MNSYAPQAGYGGPNWLNPPPPVAYRIRRIVLDAPYAVPFALWQQAAFPAYTLGDIEEHHTTIAFDYTKHAWYHGLAMADQLFADKCTALVQQACAYFYEPDETYVPMEGVASVVVTDAEVERRIAQLDDGENTREAARSHKRRYPLRELPADQQRALVEQLEALRAEFGFEKIGALTPAAMAATLAADNAEAAAAIADTLARWTAGADDE